MPALPQQSQATQGGLRDRPADRKSAPSCRGWEMLGDASQDAVHLGLIAGSLDRQRFDDRIQMRPARPQRARCGERLRRRRRSRPRRSASGPDRPGWPRPCSRIFVLVERLRVRTACSCETSTSNVAAKIGVFFELLDVQPILAWPRPSSRHAADRRPARIRGAAETRPTGRSTGCGACRKESPSTMCRARSSSREIRLIASGCKNLLESGIAGQFIFLGWSFSEQSINDVIGRDAIAFGREVDDDPMPQHRLGQRLNVVGRHMRSAVQQAPAPWRPGSGTAPHAGRLPRRPSRGRTRASRRIATRVCRTSDSV